MVTKSEANARRSYVGTHRRARRLAVIGGGAVATLVGTASAAFATAAPSTDLTGGAGDTWVTSISDYYKQHVMVVGLGLMGLFIGVGLLIRYVTKATKKA